MSTLKPLYLVLIHQNSWLKYTVIVFENTFITEPEKWNSKVMWVLRDKCLSGVFLVISQKSPYNFVFSEFCQTKTYLVLYELDERGLRHRGVSYFHRDDYHFFFSSNIVSLFAPLQVLVLWKLFDRVKK